MLPFFVFNFAHGLGVKYKLVLLYLLMVIVDVINIGNQRLSVTCAGTACTADRTAVLPCVLLDLPGVHIANHGCSVTCTTLSVVLNRHDRTGVTCIKVRVHNFISKPPFLMASIAQRRKGHPTRAERGSEETRSVGQGN